MVCLVVTRVSGADVVFLESPAGVGFSYADTAAGLMHNDTSTAADAYEAVTDFLKGFPECKLESEFLRFVLRQ